jgi:hypothetical protein
VQNYIRFAADRGLRLSDSRAVCLHAVLGVKCPDFGLVCGTDAPRPFVRIMDHRALFRRDHDRVLLVEPYVNRADAEESARVLGEVLGLRWAVGEPGIGPWAATVQNGETSPPVPVAFAASQELADLAVSEVAK